MSPNVFLIPAALPPLLGFHLLDITCLMFFISHRFPLDRPYFFRTHVERKTPTKRSEDDTDAASSDQLYGVRVDVGSMREWLAVVAPALRVKLSLSLSLSEGQNEFVCIPLGWKAASQRACRQLPHSGHWRRFMLSSKMAARQPTDSTALWNVRFSPPAH